MQLPAPSEFMGRILPRLLARYYVDYLAEDCCIEYFLQKKKTGEEISQNLMISLNCFARRIEVVRFYPELNKQPNTKYFSAACFYLLVHHFAQYFGVTNQYQVFVCTQPEIFSRFYKQLLDFNFHPKIHIANTIELVSDYTATDIDTTMITGHQPRCDTMNGLIKECKCGHDQL